MKKIAPVLALALVGLIAVPASADNGRSQYLAARDMMRLNDRPAPAALESRYRLGSAFCSRTDAAITASLAAAMRWANEYPDLRAADAAQQLNDVTLPTFRSMGMSSLDAALASSYVYLAVSCLATTNATDCALLTAQARAHQGYCR